MRAAGAAAEPVWCPRGRAPAEGAAVPPPSPRTRRPAGAPRGPLAARPAQPSRGCGSTARPSIHPSSIHASSIHPTTHPPPFRRCLAPFREQPVRTVWWSHRASAQRADAGPPRPAAAGGCVCGAGDLASRRCLDPPSSLSSSSPPSCCPPGSGGLGKLRSHERWLRSGDRFEKRSPPFLASPRRRGLRTVSGRKEVKLQTTCRGRNFVSCSSCMCSRCL